MTKSIALSILVCYHSFGQAKIDREVEAVVSHYTDTLLHENQHLPPNLYVIVCSSETIGGRKLYVTSCERLHDILSEGTPDTYFWTKGRWVFLLESNKGALDVDVKRKKFVAEFGELLSKEDTTSIFSFHPASFLYLFKDGRMVKARKVCAFPFQSILNQGKTFDEDGNLMYRDGVYDLCDLQIQGRLTSKSPLVLVREITLDSLSKKSLGAELIIDETGKVESVHLNGKDLDTLSESTKADVIELLKGMPSWAEAKISGRPVKYRVFVAL